jgi:hypothetical protein
VHAKSNDKKTLNTIERYQIYKENLLFYFWVKWLDTIIFCDNSWFSIPKEDKKLFETLAQKKWKQFELLQFIGDTDKQKRYGYAYGDQEILDYCFTYSALLKHTESWYKVSGRKKLLNFDNIISTHKNKKNLFAILDVDPLLFLYSLSTYFFKIESNIYEKILYRRCLKYYREKTNTYMVSLETLYFYLLQKKYAIDFEDFSIVPIFEFYSPSFIKKINQYRRCWWYSNGRLVKWLIYIYLKYSTNILFLKSTL